MAVKRNSRVERAVRCVADRVRGYETNGGRQLSFADEAAAQRFDFNRTLSDACGRRWHRFGSWAAAETWLVQDCVAATTTAPTS